MQQRREWDEVLELWFGGPSAGTVGDRARFWFGGNDELDQQIRSRFVPLIERAGKGDLDEWKKTPHGWLALIVLLDQFTRNAWRGTAQAVSRDAVSLGLCREGIERGIDRELGLVERAFFYMPLQHAEDRAAQDLGVEQFGRLAEEAPPELRPMFASFHDYAGRHRDVVARFGRFPHRNKALGRESTAEEIEFLKQPGSSF